MTIQEFRDDILAGIPSKIPARNPEEQGINHAPKRKQILSEEERKLALRNALRYFPKEQHAELAPEFIQELNEFGRIYMLRYRPNYKMYARPIEDFVLFLVGVFRERPHGLVILPGWHRPG